MCYYDEEFYDEPHEFNNQVEVFRQGLINSVKSDYKSEMERLRQENKELQHIKENFKAIKQEYKNKEMELERDKQDMRQKVRRERLNDLMSDFQIILYRVGYDTEELPKCNKCDEHRRIHYKTPRGKDSYERCECAEGKRVCSPKENHCYEFKIDRDNKEILAFYEYSDEYGSMTLSNKEGITWEEGMNYEDLRRPFRIFFKNKKDCQKYCDWLDENAQ